MEAIKLEVGGEAGSTVGLNEMVQRLVLSVPVDPVGLENRHSQCSRGRCSNRHSGTTAKFWAPMDKSKNSFTFHSQ